ncbi:hypothetical protein ACS0TY_024540 [Phlomoides rotata]
MGTSATLQVSAETSFNNYGSSTRMESSLSSFIPQRNYNDDDDNQEKDLREKLDQIRQQAPHMPEGGQQKEILMLQLNLGPVGGCSEWGVLMSKRKRKAEIQASNHVQAETCSQKKNVPSCQLTFTEDNLDDILIPHNDSLVVSVNIMGTKEIYESYLELCNHRILGFGDIVFVPQGIIILAVELVSTKDPSRCLTRMLYFLVVDQASIYNGFLDRPFMHEFKVVVSTYYYCVKFPTPKGAGTVKSDQKKARECLLSLSPTVQTQVSVLEQDPLSGQTQKEHGITSNQAQGEGINILAVRNDQEMANLGKQEERREEQGQEGDQEIVHVHEEDLHRENDHVLADKR